MDFDEHDDGDGDEEMPPIPVSLSYEPQLQPGLGLGGGGTPKPGDSGGGVFRTPGGCGVRGEAGGCTRYRECLKNHAVGIGGHAVDGCGEFMAAGEEGSIDALRCAACGCHRNFHRKESDWPTGAASAAAALSAATMSQLYDPVEPYVPVEVSVVAAESLSVEPFSFQVMPDAGAEPSCAVSV